MRKNQVDVITLGCSKNLVDSEQLIRQFLANGYKVNHNSPAVNGEIVVLNTCGFIGDAQEEPINMILRTEERDPRGRRILWEVQLEEPPHRSGQGLPS